MQHKPKNKQGATTWQHKRPRNASIAAWLGSFCHYWTHDYTQALQRVLIPRRTWPCIIDTIHVSQGSWLLGSKRRATRLRVKGDYRAESPSTATDSIHSVVNSIKKFHWCITKRKRPPFSATIIQRSEKGRPHKLCSCSDASRTGRQTKPFHNAVSPKLISLIMSLVIIIKKDCQGITWKPFDWWNHGGGKWWIWAAAVVILLFVGILIFVIQCIFAFQSKLNEYEIPWNHRFLSDHRFTSGPP